MRSGDAREVTGPKSMASVLQPPPSPDLERGLAEHPEAGVDCEGGGVAEVLYRGLPRGRKRQGHLPSREFKGCPGSQWIYEQVKWTVDRSKERVPFPPPPPLLIGSFPHRGSAGSPGRNRSIPHHCRHPPPPSGVRVLQ